MLDKIVEKSHAKINLFLKIINRRSDGYHNIRTGITLIDLYDEISVKPNGKFEVYYQGRFCPPNNIFDDCIIKKLFKFLKKEPPNLLFSISKNFPYQAGLGSASSNVATIIRILENLELIEKKNIYDYINLGSDIPFFLNQQDALVRGIGNQISNINFPKYYFLIIQPHFKCSTKQMYESIKISESHYNPELDIDEINDSDTGNDFEKILHKNQPELLNLFNFLNNLNGTIFTRLTGSGSCIFSVFEKKQDAEIAKNKFKSNFSNLWSCVAQNNFF